MREVKINIPKQFFKLRGPLVTATHVEVIIDQEVKRLDSVRVASEAVKANLTCLTGDPSYDKFAFLTYGALDQLGMTFEDCQIIQNNSDIIKLKAHGVKEKKHATY